MVSTPWPSDALAGLGRGYRCKTGAARTAQEATWRVLLEVCDDHCSSSGVSYLVVGVFSGTPKIRELPHLTEVRLAI